MAENMEVESLRSMRSFVAKKRSWFPMIGRVLTGKFPRGAEKNPPRPLGTPPEEGIVPDVGKADVFEPLVRLVILLCKIICATLRRVDSRVSRSKMKLGFQGLEDKVGAGFLLRGGYGGQEK